MLSIHDYEKLCLIQQRLLTINYENTFSQQLAQIFDDILGYKHMIAGNISSSGKDISPASLLHGVDITFAQEFFLEYWEHEYELSDNSDRIVFSQLPEDLRTGFYKKILHPYRFSDCIIDFVISSDGSRYTIFYALFIEKKVLSDDDLLLLDKVKESLTPAIEQYNYVWGLKSQNAMVMDCTNYFPIGIMLVEQVNRVTFANETAKDYMRQLGITSPKLYSTFFTNELFRRCKFDLLTFGTAQPIRIKNFLFSVLAISNPGENMEMISFQTSHPVTTAVNMMSISAVVYIISDSIIHHTRFDASKLENAGLTGREIEIAELIAAGKNNQEIAEQLVISANTVRIHISNIYRKLEVKTRTQLIDKLLNIQQ